MPRPLIADAARSPRGPSRCQAPGHARPRHGELRYFSLSNATDSGAGRALAKFMLALAATCRCMPRAASLHPLRPAPARSPHYFHRHRPDPTVGNKAAAWRCTADGDGLSMAWGWAASSAARAPATRHRACTARTSHSGPHASRPLSSPSQGSSPISTD